MKSATIPPVRIDPQLRATIEQSLREGESLTALVEAAVRSEIQRRQAQDEFVRRGLDSIASTLALDNGIAAATVIARLEDKLATARSRRQA